MLRIFLGWARLRAREPSTWMGMAMIVVVLGSDPLQAPTLIEACSLIIGGGLVAANGQILLRRRSGAEQAAPGPLAGPDDQHKGDAL